MNIDEAIAARPHQTYSPLVVLSDTYGNRTEVAFERSSRWEGGLRIPNPYITVWVFREESYVYRRDENGRAPESHLDWARDLIAQALGLPKNTIKLGFQRDHFDVRPY